jgi:hypothetical protein
VPSPSAAPKNDSRNEAIRAPEKNWYDPSQLLATAAERLSLIGNATLDTYAEHRDFVDGIAVGVVGAFAVGKLAKAAFAVDRTETVLSRNVSRLSKIESDSVVGADSKLVALSTGTARASSSAAVSETGLEMDRGQSVLPNLTAIEPGTMSLNSRLSALGSAAQVDNPLSLPTRTPALPLVENPSQFLSAQSRAKLPEAIPFDKFLDPEFRATALQSARKSMDPFDRVFDELSSVLRLSK